MVPVSVYSAVSVPPNACAMARAAERPIPYPETVLLWVLALSPRKNRSKSRSGSELPGVSQVFSSAITICLPSPVTEKRIIPSFGVYLTALSSRMEIIWENVSLCACMKTWGWIFTDSEICFSAAASSQDGSIPFISPLISTRSVGSFVSSSSLASVRRFVISTFSRWI